MQLALFLFTDPIGRRESVKLLFNLLAGPSELCPMRVILVPLCQQRITALLDLIFVTWRCTSWSIFFFPFAPENTRSINCFLVNNLVTIFMLYIVKFATKGLKSSDNMKLCSRDENPLGTNSKSKP